MYIYIYMFVCICIHTIYNNCNDILTAHVQGFSGVVLRAVDAEVAEDLASFCQ